MMIRVKTKMMKIFKDMLTEWSEKEQKVKVSQSRIYLLLSVLAYYITLGVLTWAGIDTVKNQNGEGSTTIDIDNFKMIVDALEYAMVLFAGYTFGGKFLDTVKLIGGKKSNDEPKLPEDSGPKVLEG